MSITDNLEYTYYIHNPYHQEVYDTTIHCGQCVLRRSDNTCPYSKKPIKNIYCTSCKYGIKDEQGRTREKA